MQVMRVFISRYSPDYQTSDYQNFELLSSQAEPAFKTQCSMSAKYCCLTQASVTSSVVRYPRYLDTYRRYLRDDTSIAKVTIYRSIS